MTRSPDDPKASAADSAPQGTLLLDSRELTEKLSQRREEAAIHSLVVIEGPDLGKRFQIGGTPRILGRSATADIVLGDHSVSSQHCYLALVDEHLKVEDLGSSNGTFRGAEQVSRAQVPVGASIRVGKTVLRHEHRRPSEVAEHEDLDHDLEKAVHYVRSLLPDPYDARGLSIRWLFRPSARLGGDGFGYHWIDDHHLALYLIDVCGHGAGSSLHAVSVIQLLRARALPDVDFRDPAQVFRALNASFQMERHAGMYFTAWYGVFETRSRDLTFASAGHPPALLLSGGERLKLQTKRPAIGLMPDLPFSNSHTHLGDAARLVLFSDGAFELHDPQQPGWNLDAFLSLPRSMETGPAQDELERLEERLVTIQGHDRFEDDLSIVIADFATHSADSKAVTNSDA